MEQVKDREPTMDEKLNDQAHRAADAAMDHHAPWRRMALDGLVSKMAGYARWVEKLQLFLMDSRRKARVIAIAAKGLLGRPVKLRAIRPGPDLGGRIGGSCAGWGPRSGMMQWDGS